MANNIKVIVTDIEGTTSSISFVKEVLFPYAYKNLPDYVWENESGLKSILDDVRKEENNIDLSLEEVIEVLLRYIDEDKKIKPLKELQGLIWKSGYDSGELKGHIYDDALKALREWKHDGIDIYIYSSGSIAAQKLLFGNTEAGDLNPLFSGYYDTGVGGKKETDSYEAIAADIGCPSSEVLFLSDCKDEIDAASAAGMEVVILDRENQMADTLGYRVEGSFENILPEHADA